MPNRLIVDQELLLGFSGRIVGKFKNGAGAALNNGDVVIYKTSDATGRSVTTTTTANDPKVAGIVIGTAPDSPAYPVLVQMWGPIDTSIVKVDGTTDIAVGDALSTFTTAGIGAKAGANKGGVYAYALEAYATNDSLGKIKVFVTALGASRQDTSAAGNTLDQSYDQGGAGSGRTINATDGAVVMQNTDVDTTDILQIDKSPTGAAAGNGLKITMGANATGPGLLLANSGSGNDVTGSAGWTVTKAGVATFAGTTLSGNLSMQGNDVKHNDNAKDVYGTGDDAQIYYDATNLVVKPAVVGTGYVDVNGPVGWTEGTAPAGTVVYAVRDNTGDLTVNAISGKAVHIAIAGTDEFNLHATELELASGNDLQFLGDDDIVDSNANELLTVSATASAVNGWQIKNAATGVAPKLGSNGTGSEVNIGFILLDSNGNEAIIAGSTASAVNEITVTNAATGNRPQISSTGGDANIGITYLAKGTGAHVFDNATEPVDIRMMGAAGSLAKNVISDLSGLEILELQPTALAVNHLLVITGATGSNVQLSAAGTGADANTGITLVAAGTGAIILDNGTDPVLLKLNGAAGAANSDIIDVNNNELVSFWGVASAVNELEVRNAATGGNVILNVTGGDANIGLNLTPKGTGQVNVAPATAGTAANPGLILDGDVNTGLFESAADKLAISTGGAVRTEWSVTGQKVGGTADHATTAGTNAVSIFNGTAPVGTVANGASLYTAVGEMYTIDAGGTATLQS